MSGFQVCVSTMALSVVVAAVPSTPAAAARTSYPASFVTLGTKGGFASHANGWYRANIPPAWYSEEFTSYCAKPPENYYFYGTLRHPKGYELTEHGYGDRIYKMYDLQLGWIRAANVDGATGKLVAPSRQGPDPCRAEGEPAGDEPPAPPPPKRGLAGGDAAVTGTYSCNTSRAEAAPSSVRLEQDGTITITPDRSEAVPTAPEPLQGTWWSFPGDPDDRGGGVALRDGLHVHVLGETVRFAVEDGDLGISGFSCTRTDSEPDPTDRPA